MGSVFLPCHPRLWCSGISFAREMLLKIHKIRHQRAGLVMKNHKTCSFSYTVADQIPLLELPQASFDQYMEQTGRVIRAICPENATAQPLHREEWRIKMPAIEALFLRFQPVIDVRVRCKCNGEDYPPHVPPHITKLYEVHTTKWELRGLHADYMPTYFNLKTSGILYPQRQGRHSFIKNQLKINISIVFPPLLALVPEPVLLNVLQSIVIKIMEDIKKGCSVRLLADYSSFKRNSSKNST